VLQFLDKTTLGKVGPDKIHDEITKILRSEKAFNIIEESELEDNDVVSHSCNNDARESIIVRPPLGIAEG
jgi:hypothetical protein